MLGIVLGVLLVYTLLPLILTRVFGIGVLRKNRTASEIALTFDDGPDPEFTPRLLRVLQRHGVRATFFVLGAKAEQHPELVRQIQADGHQIGIHGYVHQCNWLLPPWGVRTHVQRTAAIIEQITGERPHLYRPTWGLLNAVDLFLLRGFDIVLWSVMVGDWRQRIAQTKLRSRLLRRMRGGDVVVLHDSGATFGADRTAPSHMIEALDAVLREQKQRGERYVTVGEMMNAQAEQGHSQLPWQKRLLIWLWMRWELLFQKMFGIRTFLQSNPVFHYRVRKYAGPSLTLPDGTAIVRGDKVAELHLDNRMLFAFSSQARSPMKLAIQMIRHVELLMPEIARYFLYNPEFDDVKGLYGITLINRGVQQFGFAVIDLPSGVFRKLTTLYLRLLLSVLHPRGKRRLQERTPLLVPKTIVLSKTELLRRYPVPPVVPDLHAVARPERVDNELHLPNSFH